MAQQLPAELLTEIFDNCSPPWHTEHRLNDDITAAMELERLSLGYLHRLAQVCVFWRATVLNTPQLWSTVVVDTSFWPDINLPTETLLAVLRNTLERGQSSGLLLQVGMGDHDDATHSVAELLCMHSHRWHHVYIWCGASHTLGLFSSAKGNLPWLHSLRVAGFLDSGLDIFETAPRLRRFLSSQDFDRISTLAIPWHQLEWVSYTGGRHNPYYAVRGLGLMKDIGDCHLFLEGGYELKSTAWETQIPVTSNLQRLTLVAEASIEESATVLGRIFDLLTLPALTLLYIQVSNTPALWNADRFITMAERSSFHAHLTKLEIRAIITPQEMVRCLAVLDAVKELTIADFVTPPGNILITDALLAALSCDDDEGSKAVILPRLEQLDITTRLEFRPQTYIDFIASRLRYLKIRSTRIPGEPLFKQYFVWVPSGGHRLDPITVLEDGLKEWIQTGELRYTQSCCSCKQCEVALGGTLTST
ncbi:F-box domain-containing protein [Mycena chlorophos]|uniref:F-box domain-containing protein n=1 Tax=Mycena chlorophos TaxID=658473 RepID=A0A8H6ST02_MYCCL|nr:F-box domain-containing protein [Mycena chlorophos]